MKKNEKEGKSILRLLVKNYIILTVVLFVFIVILLEIYTYQANRINVRPDVDRIVAQRNNFELGYYDVLDAEKILGRLGFYEVFDELGHLLYSSDSNKKVLFTARELSLVNNILERVDVDVKYCENWGAYPNYVVTRSYYSRQDSLKRVTYTIIDENYHVVDGYYADEWDEFTQGEFNVISQNVLKNYQVNRYVYEANTFNDQYSVVFFSYIAPASELKQMRDRLYIGLFVFFVCYTVLLIIMISWTYRMVKKPLRMLDATFNKFEAGQIFTADYTGPSDFVKIFDSFDEMTKRLAQSEERRHRLEEEQNKMVANIAHDIRTPVTVISGYAKAILDGMMPPQEQRSYMESIYQKSYRLSEMVDNFAEYSKLGHPEFRLECCEQNFSEFLRAYIANKYSEFEVEGFEFDGNIPEEVIMCSVDSFQFSRVLENIIGNSIRYNKPGTTILVELERVDNMAILHVGDDGVGIDEEYWETIFDAFVVGDDSRGMGQGSGLGLALAKRIVQEHGGSLELVKKPQLGWVTEFLICIPISQNNHKP